MQEIHLKPTEASYKLGIVVAADRLTQQAANAFLKTLEEPPPRSILVLLSTEPARLLETILSRCLRLNFGGSTTAHLTPENRVWIEEFSRQAGQKRESLMARYLLLDQLLQRLEAMRAEIEKTQSEHSPLEMYPDAERQQKEQWEEELKAAIEAEYRRQRGELLLALQWWLRDVWLVSQPVPAAADMLFLPDLASTAAVAGRLTPKQATNNLQIMEQLQRWLGTNVQEALALEVGLLKLNLG
jgi:DNA polymerase-3 subunit delta'